jgi:hypothetical protein
MTTSSPAVDTQVARPYDQGALRGQFSPNGLTR